MWRVLTFLIVAFWAVMTALLVRYTWFPEGSHFAEVPPRMVLQRFLEEGSSLSTLSTLHVYQRQRKIGHAAVTSRRVRSSGGQQGNDYHIHITGLIEKGSFSGVEENISWRVELKVLNLERFGGAKGQVRMDKSSRILDFLWPPGARIPSFTLKEAGQVVVDDQLVQPMVAQMLGGGGAAGMAENLGIPATGDAAGLIHVTARESVMSFAGQKSKGYTLDFSVMDRWKARAFFTEAGELALVDLPDGYRLVEPVIHGLAPDYDEDEELEK